MVSAVGGISASAGSGVGAAVDIGSYTNNVNASIGSAKVSTAGDVRITSDTNVFYLPIAVSLVGASSFAASGSLAHESINDTTTSSVGGTLTSSENMLVSAVDSSNAIIVSGGLGESGSVGVSVGAIIPQMIRDTTASIAPGASVEVRVRKRATSAGTVRLRSARCCTPIRPAGSMISSRAPRWPAQRPSPGP